MFERSMAQQIWEPAKTPVWLEKKSNAIHANIIGGSRQESTKLCLGHHIKEFSPYPNSNGKPINGFF